MIMIIRASGTPIARVTKQDYHTHGLLLLCTRGFFLDATKMREILRNVNPGQCAPDATPLAGKTHTSCRAFIIQIGALYVSREHLIRTPSPPT
jgi:hypothetical protein